MDDKLRAWHDYCLTGYTVDGGRRQIVFNLVWTYDLETDIREANVTFSDVEGYFLQDDLGSNVLYGLEEWPLENFLEKNAAQFEQHFKQAGWPLFWRQNISDTLKYLQEKSLRCIEVSSSYGISVSVMARGVTHAGPHAGN